MAGNLIGGSRRTPLVRLHTLRVLTCLVALLPNFSSVDPRVSDVAVVEQVGNAQTTRTFPETGRTLDGTFLRYWDQNGALMQFGYPLSDELQERSETDGKIYTVQYFERTVFELHPENQPPFDVLLQLLGVFRYAQLYSHATPRQEPSTEADAVRFPETGRTVEAKFLQYWRKNGGLARFGYPISEHFVEESDLNGQGYIVQYFERAVFEEHPTNQPPYDILLAQLGTFRWRERNGLLPSPRTAEEPVYMPNIPDGEYVPLYPGTITGDLLDVWDEGYTFRRVAYRIPLFPKPARSYYDTVLPRLGWVYVASDALPPEAKENDYILVHPGPRGRNVPWNIALSVGATPLEEGEMASRVTIVYSRFPDANENLAYPNARGVSARSEPGTWMGRPAVVTTTTYTVDAQPQEVQSFYLDALPVRGWDVLDGHAGPPDIESPSGLQYLAIYWNTNRELFGMQLTVNASRGSDGSTHVATQLKLYR